MIRADHIIALEQELLTTSTRQNQTRLEQLLAKDFVEVGSSGRVWSRQEILERLPVEAPTRVVASDFKVHDLAEKVVLVTYLTTRAELDGSDSKALRSSIWKSTETGWQMFFHQGTKA